jgi:hypothetical protein
VTPPVEGSLTLLVTLLAGPLPAGGEPAADVPQAAGVAAADVSQAGAPEPAPPANPLGGGAAGAELVAAAPGDDNPRPGERGIDVPEQLRGIDLYQPTPNPDRPSPLSRRPDGPRRWDAVLLALAAEGAGPAAAAVVPAEVARAASLPDRSVADTATGPSPVPAFSAAERAADAAFVLRPPAWDDGHGLTAALALAASALWRGYDRRPENERGPSGARARPTGSSPGH